MPKSLAKFRLNGKELSLKVSNKVRLLSFLKELPYPNLLSRPDIAKKLKMSYDDSAFDRVPPEFRFRLPDRSAVYGSAATIKALRKEFAHANN